MKNPAAIPSGNADLAQQTPNWTIAAVLTITAVAALLLLFQQTALSAIDIWNNSSATYAHGYLIFPISAYLIWSRRKEIALLTPQPDLRGLPILLLLGFGWLLAYLARVQVVQEYTLVAMIPVLVWIILGMPITRALTFPLGFLFFAVPFGEFLIQPLMDFTANFTVAALQLTGIPVYREGTFFTYRSTKRRIIFTILSLIVPVIANGLRAYMIVMIAHLSNMKLALGIDHLIYGWIFFGLVMTLLFWIGSFWREDLPQTEAGKPAASPAKATPIPVRRIALTTLAAVGIAALWPGYAAYLKSQVPPAVPIRLEAPTAVNGWHADPTPLSNWTPEYSGSDATLMQTYRKGNKLVGLYVGYYRHQREGAELITSTNVLVRQKHPVWNKVGEIGRTTMLAGQPVRIIQTRLRSPALRLLVWNWDRLGNTYTANSYLAKLLEAKTRLLGQRDDATAIILSTPYEDKSDTAAAALQEFIDDMLPAIEASLKHTAGES
jgi:EpsI family protein